VPAGSTILRDRRRVSRMPARLACTFTHEGIIRPATVTDLSLGGAFLTSKFLPPKASAITISVEAPQSQKTVVLTGTVVRGSWGTSEQGDVCRFGVHFSNIAPGLIGLLRTLIPTESDRTSPEPAPSK